MLTESGRGELMDTSTRRGFLTGMALGATHLLFSRTVQAAEIFGAAQGVPAVGNAHLLTLVAVNENTLRLRVIQNGKQGPAAEIGIVPRVWPEPLEEASPGHIPWGKYSVHVDQNPWRITINDKSGATRQQIHMEPSTGAIHFSLGQGPLFGLGEGAHPFNHRGSLDAMRNGQIRY